MIKKIAILRGINVGGKRKILMADLKVMFESLGFTDIKTYIQSGNVIFNSPNKLSDNEISGLVEKVISEKYRFDVPVVVRSENELEQAIEKNPYYKREKVDINRLHLTFLKETPSKENRLKTGSLNVAPDEFIIDDKNVFVFCEGKYHQSKLTNNYFESKLKVTATTRNWKTVLKLKELGK